MIKGNILHDLGRVIIAAKPYNKRSPKFCMPMKLILTSVLLAATLLSACDQIGQQLGLDEPQRKEAKADAEGKAVGSACRQSGRAIEDCYSIYHWLPKASIFAGWREMNDYMQANNISVIEPKLPPAPSPEDKKKKAKAAAAAEAEAKSGDKKSTSMEAKAPEKSDKHEVANPEKADAKGEKAVENKEDSANSGKKDSKAASKH